MRNRHPDGFTNLISRAVCLADLQVQRRHSEPLSDLQTRAVLAVLDDDPVWEVCAEPDELRTTVHQAILYPGAFTVRGHDEILSRWQGRSVVTAIAKHPQIKVNESGRPADLAQALDLAHPTKLLTDLPTGELALRAGHAETEQHRLTRELIERSGALYRVSRLLEKTRRRKHISPDALQLADQIEGVIGEEALPAVGDPAVLANCYLVSCLPQDHSLASSFTLKVVDRYDGTWEIQWRGEQHLLSRDGTWFWGYQGPFGDREPVTDEEDSEYHRHFRAWLDEHRFDLSTALRMAKEAAPLLEIGPEGHRMTVADALARYEQGKDD